MSTWTLHSQEWEIKSVPEQLKGSENYDEIKRLHIKGESDQTQEGKHSHWEVKPGQTKNKNTQSVFDTGSETFVINFHPKKKKHIKMTEVLVRILNPNVHTPTASLDLCMWVFWSLTFWIQWLQIRQSINQHQCPSYYSQIPPRAEISHRPQTWNFQ